MARRANKRKHARGFTLIEVMGALAILGGSLLVLLHAHFAATSLYEQTQQQVILRGLFEQAVGFAEIGLLSGELSGSGEFSKRYPDFSYSYEAAQVGEADDNFVMLYQVNVTLKTPDGENKSITMMIYDSRTE